MSAPETNTNTNLIIFDTTLRDGEQSPGASLKNHEKLQIAHQLAKLQVDVIEAGFPFSSQGDFDSVKQIAAEVGTLANAPSICGLARATQSDIDACWDAVKHAHRPRIHTFIATSDIHIETKFKKSRQEILEIARAMVAHAASKGTIEQPVHVEFSAEDAGRTDPEYLYAVLEAVIAAGAKTVNIPDTVGYRMPGEFSELISGITHHVPNIQQAIISTHCHNDLGLATANSLAGVLAGARQVECTINGIGERAGNAAMEEVVMALRVRPQYFHGITTRIEAQYFSEISRLVSELTGIPVQPNKAIVGLNAFAHESGIHQDGFLKGENTYEIMRPQWIGLSGSFLPLGPRSGRAAVKSKIQYLKLDLDEAHLNDFFAQFKTLADRVKRVDDEALQQLHHEFVQSLK